MDKVMPTADAAVADIPDGASVAIAGFGIGHRFPSSLIVALRDQGAKQLTIVCNSLGAPGQLRAHILADNHQVSHLIASFSARPGTKTEAERQIASGELTVELVPQGTLVERLRAAGAGLPAFYTPTSYGSEIAAGKEVREFSGRPYVLEEAISVDYAFVRARRADRMGNLEFRGASQNFNPSFAKAARVAIAEVEEIVEVGELPPESIGLPGIFVDRVVPSTVDIDVLSLPSNKRRAPQTNRHYDDKPALTRAQIAQRAARLLTPGSFVNLGTGLPTLVSNYLEGTDVMIHAENGVLGCGPVIDREHADLDHFNAGGGFVSILPGASFFDSVTSFEMARSGKLDAVVLGAYQVDQSGALANWSTPGMAGGGIGGAMDLVAGHSTLIITMEHCDSAGRPKLVSRCTYPLTAPDCVDIVVTDLALLRRHADGFVVEETAAGFSFDDVAGLTDFPLQPAATIATMQDAFDA